MNGYEIKRALKNGEIICGSLIVSMSPKWMHVVGGMGMDFVFIDTEHVMTSASILSWMCMGYEGLGLAPIVRIRDANPSLATATLDGGAHGILVPYMESTEALEEMVGAVHYKPIKGEKLRRELNHIEPFSAELRSELEKRNRNNMLFINIESLTALEKIDDLLSVQGLDGIVIGPNDLSYSMNIPNQYNDPGFQRTVIEILKLARSKGIAAGIHAHGSIDMQIKWARESGMNMLWHSGDIYAFADHIGGDIRVFRNAIQNVNSEKTEINLEI